MIGAISLNPYVSSYQYTGSHVRTMASAWNTQSQAGQSMEAVSGTRAASAGKSGVSSLIGARSIADAGQASGVAGVSVGRGADPDSPVQPVDAVSVLQPGNSGSTNYMIPFLRKGMDPAELAVRMRIQYSGAGTEGESQAGQPVSRDAAAAAAQIDLPGSSQGAAKEALQLDLPGSSQGAAKEAIQIDLPGSSRGAAKEAIQIDLPGSSRVSDKEAVQLDLPGTSSADKAEQMGLPGTATGKAAEAGLPGVSPETEVENVDSGKDVPETAGLHTENAGKAERTPEETECKTCKERKYQDGSNDPGVSFKTPTHINPEQSASAVRGHEMEHVVNERAKAKNEGRRVVSQSVTMQTGICPECGRVYTAGGVTRTTTATEIKQEEQPKDPRWILRTSA